MAKGFEPYHSGALFKDEVLSSKELYLRFILHSGSMHVKRFVTDEQLEYDLPLPRF